MASLENEAAAETGFTDLLHELLNRDANRGTAPVNRPDLVQLQRTERVKAALDQMALDPGYVREYHDSVMSMSYASNSEIPSFEQALQAAYRFNKNTQSSRPSVSF